MATWIKQGLYKLECAVSAEYFLLWTLANSSVGSLLPKQLTKENKNVSHIFL